MMQPQEMVSPEAFPHAAIVAGEVDEASGEAAGLRGRLPQILAFC